MNRIIRQFGCIALGAAAMALAVSTDANAQKKYTFGYVVSRTRPLTASPQTCSTPSSWN